LSKIVFSDLVSRHLAGRNREDDVRGLVDEETYAKHCKFARLKRDDNYRECPNAACGHIVLGDRRKADMKVCLRKRWSYGMS
jgi:hypothetical protein